MAFKTGTPFNDDIIGTEFFDQLEGLGGNDRLYGLDGNDILKGGDGDDLLDGGAGNDQLEGGLGTDTYEIDSYLDNPVELAGEGIFDKIKTSLAAYALPLHFEALVYTGSADFWGVGNDQMNFISGGAGHDILDGGAGADTLGGGDGNDIYIFDDAGDQASELAGFGVDQIQTDLLSLTLPENVEILAYFGTGDFQGTGNDDHNYLQGDEGDDTLTALAGNDILDGLTGADTMIGGQGDDKYRVDSFLDVVTELDGEGLDEVSTAIGDKTNAGIYILPSFVESFVGTSSAAQGVWLNALNNVALMGPGNDLVVLHDGGIDYVDGGAGNDFFYWGSTFATPDSSSDDRSVGGAGNDTVGLLGNYNLVLTPTCLVGIERLAMYSAGNAPGAIPNIYNITTVDANVAAGASLVVIALSLRGVETLTFNGAAETNGRFNVRGGRGGDTITTGAGSDQINGFLGADQLRGGAGNDYFEYYDALHSTAAAMDSILDFTAGDRINLVGIDADGNAANGNSAFSFIGASAFHNQAGELRAYQSAGGGWFVEGDVNGDGAADLVISVAVTDLHALTAADFLL